MTDGGGTVTPYCRTVSCGAQRIALELLCVKLGKMCFGDLYRIAIKEGFFSGAALLLGLVRLTLTRRSPRRLE